MRPGPDAAKGYAAMSKIAELTPPVDARKFYTSTNSALSYGGLKPYDGGILRDEPLKRLQPEKEEVQDRYTSVLGMLKAMYN